MKCYIDFINYCIKEQQGIPVIKDWDALFLFMKKQSLLGIGFYGIDKLRKNRVEIPKHLLLRWYSISEKIKWQNELLNKRSVEIVQLLNEKGIKSCILKGQGNAVMYPNPYMRMSGDVDVWTNGGRQKIMDFVRTYFLCIHLRFHHVDFPIFKDTTVELHFVPSSMNNPIYNRRLSKWFEKSKKLQFEHFVQLSTEEHIPVPTIDFNIIYLLAHMMHHFFDEGIGLRQMMDYYFLLKKKNEDIYIEKGSFTASGQNRDGFCCKTEELVKDLKSLGLYKFAGAVMYIMQEVFGMEKEWMIVPVDVKRGKILMAEILKGGNFGKHSGLTKHNIGVKYFLKIQRNMRFVREYPAEALFEPLFRTWHFFWRVWNRTL